MKDNNDAGLIWTIGKKIAGLTFGLLAFLLLTSASAIYNLSRIGNEIEMLQENVMPTRIALREMLNGKLEQSITRLKIQSLTLNNETEKGKLRELEGQYDDHVAKVQESAGKAASLIETLAGSRPLFRERASAIAGVVRQLKKEHEDFGVLTRNVIRLTTEGQAAKAASLLPQIDRKDVVLTKKIDDASDAVADMGKDFIASAKAIQARAMAAAGIFSLLAFLGGIFMSIVITRAITLPLNQLTVAAQNISEGNLASGKVDVRTTDEIGELADIFNKMTDSLRELARQNLVGTENLNTSAADILATIQQQAASAKEQASAVHETTTTMEEVRQSGLQISERAKRVAADAEATTTSSASGLKSVQEAVRTMTSIREQVEQVAANIVALSEKNQAVGDIVATVTDIAEQANLLALNAAIEAAAAGEQGRSFSVVANELKNLAEQAKQGTVQVRSILGEIQKGINSAVMLTEEAVKRVESGKQQTDAAERTIRQMGETTQQSVSAFQQIVAATSQQHIGFEQVGQALVNIRQASEQTVSGTGQLEKATVSLSALSQQLRKSVERYQI